MERRSFFKKLGLGAAAIMVAPKIIEAAKESPVEEFDVAGFTEDIGIRPFVRKYPETYEECWQPHFVETTTPLRDVGDGVYEVGLSDNFIGRNVVVAHKFTESGCNVSCLITEKVLQNNTSADGRLYKIICYSNSERLKDMPVGTKLAIGASAFSFSGNVPDANYANVRDMVEKQGIEGTQDGLKDYFASK